MVELDIGDCDDIRMVVEEVALIFAGFNNQVLPLPYAIVFVPCDVCANRSVAI